jgi:pimeloyl-ACP methyl ester carboxylesterase
MTDQERQSNTTNSDLHVEKIGDAGQDLLMLHGWGQNLESMRGLGELLSKHARVHLVDLPGFGRSPAPSEDWDTVGYAERIRKYLIDNNIVQADMLGHSFGGRVSIRLASRYPELVRSVTLINSGGLKRVQGKAKLKSRAIQILGKTLKMLDKTFGAKVWETWFVPRFASVDYKNAGKLRNILVKTVNEDVTEAAGKITAPVFLLWGELDTETPLEMGQRYNTIIRNSKLVVLPGKGHFPFLGDSAHLCARYIIEFLKGVNAETARAGKEGA